MEEYASNSHRSKQLAKEEPEKKKVEAVVTGVAKPRKNEVKKLASIFLAEDISNVKSYILMDIVVPAVKDAIEDVIHMLLRGEGSRKKSTNASKVSYRSYYDRDGDRRDYPKAAKSVFDYEEILFETRGDAEAVLDAMNDIIKMFGSVSVADFYDLAKIQTSNYTANKYGWTDIYGCKAVRVRDGYILKLPRPIPLNVN